MQQRKLRSSYPFAKDFAWTMAFNGANAVLNAPRRCNVAAATTDPLTSLTRCYKNEFYWANHTWNHAYTDAPTGYDAALGEITKNTLLALRLGLVTPGYGVRGLVTGDISGLGWFAPGGPDSGPEVDFGLAASNREFLRAAKNAGVRYLAANMSVRSHEPVNCWGCGINHPLEPRILLVPRWPTNLFATPTTPADMMDAYNLVYGPNGFLPGGAHHAGGRSAHRPRLRGVFARHARLRQPVSGGTGRLPRAGPAGARGVAGGLPARQPRLFAPARVGRVRRRGFI